MAFSAALVAHPQSTEKDVKNSLKAISPGNSGCRFTANERIRFREHDLFHW